MISLLDLVSTTVTLFNPNYCIVFYLRHSKAVDGVMYYYLSPNRFSLHVVVFKLLKQSYSTELTVMVSNVKRKRKIAPASLSTDKESRRTLN